jgi:hypothetical protein
MLRFTITDAPCRKVAPLAQIRRTTAHVVGIGCKDMDHPVLEHPFAPISRISTERASERASGNLQPNACLRELPY